MSNKNDNIVYRKDVPSLLDSNTDGSILGPLLFINDIANASKLFNFIIYANDTTFETTTEILIREHNNTSIERKINYELQSINEWLQLNTLSLSINKSKYMIFHMSQKNINPLQLKIE